MKILPTIGPETIKYKNLKFILDRTDIVRLNSSHNTTDWRKSAIKKIKKINARSVILIDFPGVKPRTNNKTSRYIKKNNYAFLITISFPKKGTSANSISLIRKKDF